MNNRKQSKQKNPTETVGSCHYRWVKFFVKTTDE